MTTRVGHYECMNMIEAADFMNRDHQAFRANYRDVWKIPHLRIGGRVWFVQDDLELWIEKHRRNDLRHESMQARVV